MPHKFNAARRHQFEKKRYRVTNWAEYNESLRQRGDLTIWVTDDALGQWSAPRRTTRGGQAKYSDLAITICLTLGVVYTQPLRQTQGLMRGISKLMGLGIPVPDFSTLSRRGRGLSLPAKFRVRRTECQRRRKFLPVGRSKSRPFGAAPWGVMPSNSKHVPRRVGRQANLMLGYVLAVRDLL